MELTVARTGFTKSTRGRGASRSDVSRIPTLSGSDSTWRTTTVTFLRLPAYLCVFGGHLPHRLGCHIEITRLCCQKFLLALLTLYTGATLFLTLLSEHTCEI